MWVQCCEPACNKWRRMPLGYRADDPRFAGDWYCDMNPDREMAAYGCDAPEEVDEVRSLAFPFFPFSVNLLFSSDGASVAAYGCDAPQEADEVHLHVFPVFPPVGHQFQA